jgi:hypothetical protein
MLYIFQIWEVVAILQLLLAFNISFSDIFVLFIMYMTGSTLPREDFWQHLCNEKAQEV